MVSNEFANFLNPLLFPVKLYQLAHSDEVKSVNWSEDGKYIKLDTDILGKECFRPEIFNVADHKHVFRQLSYYGFVRYQRIGSVWEFFHPHFSADDLEKVRTIKRKGKKNKNALTAADVKPILTQIKRRSQRLKGKVKEGAFSSYYETSELTEEPSPKNSTPFEAEKQPKSKRGRPRKRDIYTSEKAVLKNKANLDPLNFHEVKPSKDVKPNIKSRRKCGRSTSSTDLASENDLTSDTLISLPSTEKPKALRDRRKRNESSVCRDRMVKKEPVYENPVTSEPKSKSRSTSRGRKRRGGRKKNASSKNRKNDSCESSFENNIAEKDSNLLKLSMVNDSPLFNSCTMNSHEKDKVDIQSTEVKKLKTTYTPRRRRKDKRKKEDPSYHATLKSEFKNNEFSYIDYNGRDLLSPLARNGNSVKNQSCFQIYEQETLFANNSSNKNLRSSLPTDYSQNKSCQIRCSENGVSDCIVNCELKPDQFVKMENNVLRNNELNVWKSFYDSVDATEMYEMEGIRSNCVRKKVGTGFLDYYHEENTPKFEKASVSNELKISEKSLEKEENVKSEPYFEQNKNFFVSKIPHDSQETNVYIGELKIQNEVNKSQNLIQMIQNEHNYFSPLKSSDEDPKLNYSNLNSEIIMNKSSCHELNGLGYIKVKEEYPNIFFSDSKHFVLGKGYNWKPVSKNLPPEVNPACRENSISCSLGNIAYQPSVSRIEDNNFNNTSSLIFHQPKTLYSSSNLVNLPSESNVNNKPVDSEAINTKQKFLLKLGIQNTELKNIDKSFQGLSHLSAVEFSGLPERKASQEQNLKCVSSSFLDVSSVLDQTGVLGSQVEMSSYPFLNKTDKRIGEVRRFNCPITNSHSASNSEIEKFAYSEFKQIDVCNNPVPMYTYPDLKTNSCSNFNQNTVHTPYSGCNSQIGRLPYSASEQNNACNERIAMSAFPDLNQTNSCNSQFEMDTYLNLNKISTYNSPVGRSAYTASNAYNACYSPTGRLNCSTFEQSNACNGQNKISRHLNVNITNATNRQTEMNTCPNLNKTSVFGSELEINHPTDAQQSKLNHPHYVANKVSAIAYLNSDQINSSSNKICATINEYPSFCQNLNNVESPKTFKKLQNNKKHKKAKKSRKLASERISKKKSVKKFHTTKHCHTQSNSAQEIQNSNIKMAASSTTVLPGSRIHSSDDQEVSLSELEEMSDLEDFGIEVVDLTRDISMPGDNNLIGTENDHSEIYIKQEIEEEDYDLPHNLKNEFIQYLHGKYVSGRMTISDLLESDNPYVRFYAMDAITLQYFPEISNYS